MDGSTPGDICNDVSVEHAPSPVLIGIVPTSPPFVLIRSLQITKARQSTSSGLGGKNQKIDAVVDGKLPDDMDSASIFMKVIGHKLFIGYNGDLYMRCRMNFTNYSVQTQTPHFMDLRIPAINTLNERSILGTTATRI